MGSHTASVSIEERRKPIPSVAPGSPPAPPRPEGAPRRRRVPRGGKAGYAGEEATWSRDRLSRHHIITAHNFAESAESIEELELGDTEPEEKWRYRAYVTGAVLSASAYLEASINELYLELQKLSATGDPPLRDELALLLRAWPQIVRAPVLQKYQIALSVSDADQYNDTRPPFVDADSVMRLRDALLSYDPEWDDSRGRHQTLEKRLNKKFPPSPLVSSQRPWFPDRCLGAGCAKWAVLTVQLFHNDFCHRMAIPARPIVGGDAAT